MMKLQDLGKVSDRAQCSDMRVCLIFETMSFLRQYALLVR